MSWHYTPYALPLIVAATVCGLIAFHAFQRRALRAALPFRLLMAAIALWSLAYAFELGSLDLRTAIFWANVEYLGITAIPGLWLAFAFVYTGREEVITWRTAILAAVEPVITVVLAWTDSWHGLMRGMVVLNSIGPFSALLSTYGAWFWINVVYSYLLLLAGTILIARWVIRAPRIYQLQGVIILAGGLVPWLGNALYIFKWDPIPYLDLTPFAFTISGLLITWGLFRFRLLDVAPIARHAVIESLADGVIALDILGRVVDANPAALRMIGRPIAEVIGQPGGSVFSIRPDLVERFRSATRAHEEVTHQVGDSQRVFDVRISPVRDGRGRLSGRLIMLRDVTESARIEEERRERERFLTLLHDMTRAAIETADYQMMLETMAERMAGLLNADSCHIALWDEEQKLVIPAAAFGPMRSIFLSADFRPGEVTLTSSTLEAGHAVVVDDIMNTPHISARVASQFPARSALGLPLVAAGRKLGAALITFKQAHRFTPEEIARAEQAAGQIALAMAKANLLQTTQRQLRELVVLHAVAVAGAAAMDEDELIGRVTHIIGEQLYSENFGILLLDERANVLCVHPSYRLPDGLKEVSIPLGKGVTGRVAADGVPRRIGDVSREPNYEMVDSRTHSELCVPLKIGAHVIGVINAERAAINGFTEDDERLAVTLAGQLATAIERLRAEAAKREQAHQLATIYDVGRRAASILSLDQLLAEIARLITESMKFYNVAIAIVDGEELVFRAGYGGCAEAFRPGGRLRIGGGITGTSVASGKSWLVPDVSGEPAYVPEDGLPEVRAELAVPLRVKDQVIGVLDIASDRVGGIGEDDVALMEILADQVAVAIENARLFEEVQRLATQDSLLAVNNRRHFFELAEREFSRARRFGHSLSAIMLDIDHFKRVNDKYGHAAGDQVLRRIAELCCENIRDIDILGRYGGEEFSILLPETDLAHARSVAERLRRAVAETPVPTQHGDVRVTISVGVASLNGGVANLAALLNRADEGLYAAKQTGRNRVRVGSEGAGEQGSKGEEEKDDKES